MSSEMFETLEEEIVNLNEAIEKRVEKLNATAYGESRKKLIGSIEDSLAEAKSLLSQLDGEVRQAPHPYRSELAGKARQHHESVRKLNAAFRDVLGKFSDGRGGVADPRTVVIEGKAALERTSQSIARSTAVAIETEEIGNQVIGELGTQRESLMRTKSRLHDTDAEISRGRKILRAMYMNVIYNKLSLIGIIVTQVIIIAVLIYLKFIR